jgi:hypothetical protein
MKKSVITILAVAVVLLSFLGPLFYAPIVQAQDPAEWYMTVPGVLDSDYYTLYPYENKSLKLGFSKYGELINSAVNVGLEYDEVDPFAPPAGTTVGSIPKVMWLQGWLINITYIHATLGPRCVWAMALHSDTHAFGGSWIRVDFAGDYNASYGSEDPTDPGYIIGDYAAGSNNFGGRKTNGTAVTEPIRVLYDGPRRFVALLNTTIYDHPVYLLDSTEYDIPLVRILITVIFNKVKKEVILLKDVRSLLSEKVALKMKVQFSNRGEVDLGTEEAGYHSYFHFWTQGTGPEDSAAEGQDTCYNASWTVCKTEPSGTLSAHGGEPGAAGKYDVAQVINPMAGYVWAAAFWPSLSDWSIDGWNEWSKSLTAADPHWVDADPTVGEPKIPFYIGEWDFSIWATTFFPHDPIQFRGVTVYVLTDLNDGEDADMNYGYEDKIDKEVKYQLDEIFNPWDLVSTVPKGTMRWVDFLDGNGTTTTFNLARSPINTAWDEYCSFAERVMVDYDENGGFDPDEVLARDVNYTIDFATGEITFMVAPPSGENNIKVLYSTNNDGRYEWITVGRDAATVDSAGAALVSAMFKQKNVTIGIAGEDMFDPEIANQIPDIMHKFGTANAMVDYKDALGRAALKDDWCTTWPVASSNIIGVGGPLAHVLAYYANDFTDAYYDTTTDEIVALTCWGKNTYASSNTTGYAVITTYKDINGTVLFLIWGHWGRDTYYATKWFHEGGAEQLQEAPECLTTIILEIDYTVHEPSISIVEALGTISETLWIHGEEEKGGIHDPYL